MNTCENVTLNFDVKNYLLGPYPLNLSVEDIIYLEIKRYIYRCKCTNNFPNVYQFKISLKRTYITRKYIAIENNELDNFNETWESISQLLQ